MEFCSDNLKNILEYKHLVFRRTKNDKMTELEYHISCKIFIELLEGLNYLHELTPPIIHRNIKPGNILFKEEGINRGIFFKLSDFGLAEIYDDVSHTKNVGTHNYMAPEVWDGTYDTKADVYSLSIVAQQIFDLDNNLTGKYIAPEIWSGHYDTKVDIYSLSIVAQQIFDLGNNSSRNDKMGMYFKIIEQLLEEMRKVNYKKRPTCRNIIDRKNEWCLPSIPSTNFSNDNDKCQSLNIYVKYHLRPKI